MRLPSHPIVPTLSGALLLAPLSACAPAAYVPHPNITLPPSFEESSSAPASTEGDADALDRWWLGFNDQQLTSLIDTALERSTTIRLAFARLSEARAVRSQTRAGTLPTGTLSVDASESGNARLWGAGASSPGRLTYDATLYPSWEIDLFGRLAATRNLAQHQYEASAYDFEGVRLALAADVAVGLFQARGTAADLENAKLSLGISEDLARTAKLGEKRGLNSGQDVARLETNVASAQAEVVRLQGELRAAKRSLLILVGNADRSTDSLPIAPELKLPPALPAVTPAILLARRPDVLSAERSLQVAALGAEIDRLALFPKLNLQPGIGLSAAGSSTGFAAGGTGLWSIAAGMTLPVLDRARLLAQFRISEARGEQAAISFERTVQQAFGEAENSLTRLGANEQRLADLERAEERSHTAYQIAQRSYRAGLIDLTTLLQTQSTWLQARSSRNAGRLAMLTGTIAAVRALGGGWTPEAAPLASATPSTLLDQSSAGNTR